MEKAKMFAVRAELVALLKIARAPDARRLIKKALTELDATLKK